MMQRRRGRATDSPEPILITDAALSLDDQHDARKRKYLIMMGLRIVCLLIAVATAPISLWLAVGFIVAGLALPWAAVIIANDRPPKRASRFVRFWPPPDRPALPPGGGDADPGSSGSGSV
jgi:Protein of unknown function (DUF3099)